MNTPNVAFSFQATGLQDVSDVLSNTWNASSGSVIIHPAKSTTSGTITLNIKDAALCRFRTANLADTASTRKDPCT